MNPITRTQVEISARKLIGSPWHHQGRSLTTGIDCIGGVIFIMLDTKHMTEEEVKSFDVHNYSRTPDAYETLLTNMGIYLMEIPVSSAKHGDVLTFRMPGERVTSHVGTIVRGEREYSLIHSLQNKITLEEQLRRWYKFATHAYAFRGIID